MSSAPRLVAFLPAAFAAITAGCGAGSMQRENLDRDMITSEDLANPNESIEAALQRKVPGLRVTRNAQGEIALEIRGGASFRGAASPPLWVLDGQPFEPGPGGVLSGVSPENIETIRILRSAEASLYGGQGVNGVIEITTKRAGRKATP